MGFGGGGDFGQSGGCFMKMVAAGISSCTSAENLYDEVLGPKDLWKYMNTS